MARATFGGSTSDFAVRLVNGDLQVVPNAVGTAWTASSGGTRLTDLALSDGTSTDSVYSDANGLVAFLGPDGYTSVYVDFGYGRFRMDAQAGTFEAGTAPAGGWPATSLAADVQADLGEIEDGVTKVAAGTIETDDIKADAVTQPKLEPAVRTLLDLARTSVQPDNPIFSGTPLAPATSSTLGTIKLTGDLGGIANSPTVPGLASKVDTSDARLSDARTPTTHTHDADAIITGVLGAARLGTGSTADGSRVLTDGAGGPAWQLPAGGSGGGGTAALVALTGPGPHTFLEAWAGAVLLVDSPSAAQVTLPSGVSPGVWATATQVGAGAVTIAAGNGASITKPTSRSAKTSEQFAQVAFVRMPDSGAALPAGLVMLLDGDSLGSSGASISSWADTSGNSLPAPAQATSGNRPTVAVDGFGYKAAHFDGSNDFLSLSGTYLDVDKNRAGLTLFAVAKMTSTFSGNRTVFSLAKGATTASATRCYLQRTSAGAYGAGGRILDADSSVGVTGGTVTQGAAFLIMAKYDYTNGDCFLYVNGALVASNTSWHTGGNTSNTSSLAGAVGANPDGSSEWFPGDVYYVGAYASALSDANRAKVDSFLQNKYTGLFTTSDYTGANDQWLLGGALA